MQRSQECQLLRRWQSVVAVLKQPSFSVTKLVGLTTPAVCELVFNFILVIGVNVELAIRAHHSSVCVRVRVCVCVCACVCAYVLTCALHAARRLLP